MNVSAALQFLTISRSPNRGKIAVNAAIHVRLGPSRVVMLGADMPLTTAA
jgi:hypothetical protein